MHNGAPVHFMNRQQIQEIILRVLAECGEQGKEQELPLDFPVEVSAKHVHLTREAVEQLFGTGAKLTPKRPLSQPGQFLSEERVTLVTSKGRIENVAVLGPERAAVQTELSLTDCRTLGIDAPLRMSGDLTGAGDVYIIGSMGMIHAKGSVIIAQAHIHITPPQAEQAGITDGQRVSVTVGAERRTTLENVICRVSSQAALAMHIDFDEANACILPKHATARMKIAAGRTGNTDTEKETCVPEFEGKLITEAVARKLASGSKKKFALAKGVILTPSAKDVLRHAGIEVYWQEGRRPI